MDNTLGLAPFFVGQIIIAKRDHPFGVFNKGDEFLCFDIKKSLCACKKFVVDIGLKTEINRSSRCMDCLQSNQQPGVWFFDAKRFVAKSPLTFQRLTFHKIQEEVLSGVN